MSTDFIHRFVPASGGSPAAKIMLLLLHGTGGNENDLLPIGAQLLPGAAMLSPRGQVPEMGVPRWFRRFAEGVFDVPDLIARSRELAEFVAASSERYGFDPKGVVPVGYSNGANIAASMLLLGLMRCPAAVLFRPMVPLVPEEEPDLSQTKIFIGAGQHDALTSTVETAKLIALFEGGSASVETHFEDAGHSLTSGDIEAAKRWLKTLFNK